MALDVSGAIKVPQSYLGHIKSMPLTINCTTRRDFRDTSIHPVNSRYRREPSDLSTEAPSSEANDEKSAYGEFVAKN
jgi:hypothetical protein